MVDLPTIPLRGWRNAKGMSLARLARELRLDCSALRRIDRGVTKRPHPETLARLAGVFGVSLLDLCSEPVVHPDAGIAAKHDASFLAKSRIIRMGAFVPTRVVLAA